MSYHVPGDRDVDVKVRNEQASRPLCCPMREDSDRTGCRVAAYHGEARVDLGDQQRIGVSRVDGQSQAGVTRGS